MFEQSRKITPKRRTLLWCLLVAACGWSSTGTASNWQPRADAQYHAYRGGFIEVRGPAAAPVAGDQGSPYHDERDVAPTPASGTQVRSEYGFGLDYIYRQPPLSPSYLVAGETDPEARLFSLGVLHQVFGGTTLRMGVGRHDDPITDSAGYAFEDSIDRFNYTLGISQVLSRSLLMNVDYAANSDEGYPGSRLASGGFAGAEVYPESRPGTAVSLRALKSWTPNASTLFGYQYFWDSWDIQAHSWEAGYSNKLHNGWLVDLYYRYYTQERASVSGDDLQDALSYEAGERELSAFVSNTVGAKLSYPVFRHSKVVQRGTLNVAYEFIDYDYADYSSAGSGSENPYSFSAEGLHFYFSIWY